MKLLQKFMPGFALLLFVFTLQAQPDPPAFGVAGTPEREYKADPNDPTGTRIYTLDNGLTVYLSQNKDEPRIMTYLAVRTGSKNDPEDKTGLAHYLEHMLFKGSHDLATTNWEEEQKILKEISDTYEVLNKTTDEEERAKVYAKIDSLSGVAAKYTVPNEYDNLIASMGARRTNAWTSLDETVYVNEIPSSHLEQFLKLEANRFETLVLRLFHTELETVYEEFNRAQDNDGRKVSAAIKRELFKNHTYGKQTTLGRGEDLKNPSMERIHEYFETYYRPNNCALILVGDLDFDQTIEWVEKYYSGWEPGDIPQYQYTPEAPITKPVELEVLGPEAEWVEFTFRFKGYKTEEAMMMHMVDMMLDNGSAGLIDLNLVKNQEVLRAGSYHALYTDYSWHTFWGEPKDGQTLEEVRDLILKEIDKIKKGEFDDWLMKAVINDMRLSRLRSFEGNYGRASSMVDAFIYGAEWEDYLGRLDKMAALTKKDIMEFAQKHYNNNYVLAYKRQGEDPSVLRLTKPEITPLELNRTAESVLAREIKSMPEQLSEPLFVDFNEAIDNGKLSTGVPFSYIQNHTNDLFSLYYILDMGSWNDMEMAWAIEYLEYLGTDKYSPTELSQEFFKLGLDYSVSAGQEQIYVYLSGLESSLEEGVKLFEHFLNNAVANKETYNTLVSNELKDRQDAKTSKSTILWSRMRSHAMYGPDNPAKRRLSEDELKKIDPNKLVEKIHQLTDYKHRVFYYGRNKALAESVLNKHHIVKRTLLDYPEAVDYEVKDFKEPTVYFVNYDMVQTQFIMGTKSVQELNTDLIIYANLFNEYFGSGLSSIVFQEIREKEALAYSSFATFTTPGKTDDPHMTYAFVGTQSDKLIRAIEKMQSLLTDMPESEKMFQAAKEAVKKKIASDRITKQSIFWTYENYKDMGIDYDYRKDIYEAIDEVQLKDLVYFFDTYINGKNFDLMIIGKKDDLDMEALSKFGKVVELELEEIFGY